MTGQHLTQHEIDRRMTAAAQAEEDREYRTAAHLYDELGKDIQTRINRFDSRALDAFEGVARVIGKQGSDEGAAK